MSQDEIKRLLAMAANIKVRTMLSLAYGCGLRAGEVVRLKVGDIDSAQNIIRIVQAKGRKDRNVMLPADILGLLRLWWKERPRHQDRDVAPPERWLFPGRNPGRPLTTRQFARLFHVAGALHKGQRQPIDTQTANKLKIVTVFFAERRQRQHHIGHVHALAVGNRAAGDDRAFGIIRPAIFDLQADLAIIDQQ